MEYETYIWMSYICAGLSGLFLICSIFLFFKLKIKSVIGDLTGTTAKKAIDSIRNSTSNSQESVYKVRQTNHERGHITDRISQSGTLQKNVDTSDFYTRTEKLETNSEENETAILDYTINETTILDVESDNTNETTILINEENEVNVYIEDEIIFINTQERIE